MPKLVVEILTHAGQKVGSFRNAKLEMLPDHHYCITGIFYEPDGTAAERVEFNPQSLPYRADIAQVSQCGHKTLVDVYVQRGRQPVGMTGICDLAKAAS